METESKCCLCYVLTLVLSSSYSMRSSNAMSFCDAIVPDAILSKASACCSTLTEVVYLSNCHPVWR